MFVRIPQQEVSKEYAAIYAEAGNPYSEVSTGQHKKEKKH